MTRWDRRVPGSLTVKPLLAVKVCDVPFFTAMIEHVVDLAGDRLGVLDQDLLEWGSRSTGRLSGW